jgi:hypothetical protein
MTGMTAVVLLHHLCSLGLAQYKGVCVCVCACAVSEVAVLSDQQISSAKPYAARPLFSISHVAVLFLSIISTLRATS